MKKGEEMRSPLVGCVRERKEGNIWLPFAAWRHANEGGVMQ
jgi:hypothetical protein